MSLLYKYTNTRKAQALHLSSSIYNLFVITS
jgi:hypothetical protein